eukprot:XP_781943.3 PREDICTED: RNA-binding protein 34 [Strongylocentrotus purpuratus]
MRITLTLRGNLGFSLGAEDLPSSLQARHHNPVTAFNKRAEKVRKTGNFSSHGELSNDLMDTMCIPADRRPNLPIDKLTVKVTQKDDHFDITSETPERSNTYSFDVGPSFETSLVGFLPKMSVTASWEGDNLLFTAENGFKMLREIVEGQMVTTVSKGDVSFKVVFDKVTFKPDHSAFRVSDSNQMEGKQKRKRTKKKEKKKEINQSGNEYVPGSIANFLGSNPEETSTPSGSQKRVLASFFQPSATTKQNVTLDKAGKDTPEGRVSKNKNNKTQSEEKASNDGQTNIQSEDSSPDKKLPQKGSKRRAQDDDDEPKSKRKKSKKEPMEPMDPIVLARTVFVGNLPVNITKKELKGLFKIYGAIESMRFRSMGAADPSMSKKVAAIKQELNPKKTSFNAYIVFEEEQCARAALASNGKIVNKHHMRVDIAGNNKKHDMKRSLFVGNLAFNIDDEAVRNHFEEFGTVEGVRLIRDKATGVGKGFGYVLFEDSSSVQFALKMDGTKLNGRPLRVKRAVKKEKQKQQRDHSNTRSKIAHRRSNSKSRPGSGAQGQAGPRKPPFKGKVKKRQKPGGNHKGKQKR